MDHPPPEHAPEVPDGEPTHDHAGTSGGRAAAVVPVAPVAPVPLCLHDLDQGTLRLGPLAEDDLAAAARLHRTCRMRLTGRLLDPSAEPPVGHWALHWGRAIDDPLRFTVAAHLQDHLVGVAAGRPDGTLVDFVVDPSMRSSRAATLLADACHDQMAGSRDRWVLQCLAGDADEVTFWTRRGWRLAGRRWDHPPAGRGSSPDGRVLLARLVHPSLAVG